MSKAAKIEKRLSRVEQKYRRVLEQNRVEWFQQICREAKATYGFASLGELITWMIDHAGDIQLKSGDVNVEVTEYGENR